jgi:hypothetical protein
MKAKLRPAVVLLLTVGVLLLASSRLPADTGTCGGAMTTVPFTDVMGNIFFCQIGEAFFSGLTNGTTPTTYSPNDFVRRDQMAAFVSRTQDAALRRGSRRAALGQWDTPSALPTTTNRTSVGVSPFLVASDGADLWVANNTDGSVTQVQASDGRVMRTLTGATAAFGVLIAGGAIWITGANTPGHLYRIDPNTGFFTLAQVSNTLDPTPEGIASDGTFIWTANVGGSVGRYSTNDGSTTNFKMGFSQPDGIIFDGANLWVTDLGDNMLKKLDSNGTGTVIQSVPVEVAPRFPVFDGSNIWVPNSGAASVTVVRARDGMILATLTGNGLNGPVQAAFDGERILVTNSGGNSLSLWKAADLTPIGNLSNSEGTGPWGACSDGINFWITLLNSNQLARL